MKRNKPFRQNHWVVFLSIGTVIVSVWTFGAIQYFANDILHLGDQYSPILMIGMIGPMALFVGIIASAFARRMGLYSERLAAAIELVAKGKFETRLDEGNAGAYGKVYANFNSMCEELQKVQTLRDDFINNFSHEFKTPITSISGFARLLLEEKVSAEERTQYLEIIAAESERLAEMSGNALMITKLDSMRTVPDARPFRLDEQIKRCAILLSPQWSKKKIDLEADLDEVRFNGNEELIRHAWINLIGNAIKYTPEGGAIRLSLKVQGDRLTTMIADTGVGMTEDERRRCFDKYFQGDPGQPSRGLGLGLAIVKRILELSGGSVSVTSAPGKGSAFTVNLPQAD